jgi:uncharacterized protein YlzI (FlbEa/FlbD family)
MTNGDQYEADEAPEEVVSHVFNARKANRPLISIDQAHTHPSRQIWLNPNHISEIRSRDDA